MKRKLADLFIAIRKNLRLLALLLLACALLWSGKLVFDRLTASDAKWHAEMLKGDQAPPASSEAFIHYNKALHEARKFGSQDRRVIKSTIKLSKVRIYIALGDNVPCNVRDITNKRFFDIRADARYILDEGIKKGVTDLSIAAYKGHYLNQSESDLKKTIHIIEKSRGPVDIELIEPLLIQVELYCFTMRSSLAEPIFKRALSIAERNYGYNDPRVADLIIKYAFPLEIGQLDSLALSSLQHAYDIRTRHPGKKGEALYDAACELSLFIYYRRSDNSQDNLQLWLGTIHWMEKLRLNGSLEYWTMLATLKGIYQKLNRSAEYEQTLMKMIRWDIQFSKSGGSRYHNSDLNELTHYYKQQHPEQILPLLRNTLSMSVQLQGNYSRDTRDVYEALMMYYQDNKDTSGEISALANIVKIDDFRVKSGLDRYYWQSQKDQRQHLIDLYKQRGQQKQAEQLESTIPSRPQHLQH